MFCTFHKKRMATDRCTKCSLAICTECRIVVKGKYYCHTCSALPMPGVKFTPWRMPGRAVWLSLLFPGAGQVYNGQKGKGFLIFLTSWIILPWIYGIYDAHKTAGELNRREIATKPVTEALVGFIIMVIICYSVLFGFCLRYSRIDHDALLAKETLESISQSAEEYARDHGRYPLNFSEMYFATPPYLEELYCDVEISGYTYTCDFSEDGYTITAKSGWTLWIRKSIVIRTGGGLDFDVEVNEK